jgi:ribose 5-phosphate isomerase B
MTESVIWNTVYLAADHAGFSHKEAIKEWLVAEGFTVIDVGASVFDAKDDFPSYMFNAALGVQQNNDACAIIFGGSGQGEAMAANRFVGVRATVFYGGDEDIITLSRTHNDANILSIGARFVSIDDVKRLAWQWLHTATNTEEKYARRNVALDTPPFI